MRMIAGQCVGSMIARPWPGRTGRPHLSLTRPAAAMVRQAGGKLQRPAITVGGRPVQIRGWCGGHVMPERPAGVPADAEWDCADEEWVQVPHPDEQGRKHGLVTFWRRDGSLMARQVYRNGVAHGSYSRYHESG